MRLWNTFAQFIEMAFSARRTRSTYRTALKLSFNRAKFRHGTCVSMPVGAFVTSCRATTTVVIRLSPKITMSIDREDHLSCCRCWIQSSLLTNTRGQSMKSEASVSMEFHISRAARDHYLFD